jgi:hypothetical protein
MHYVNSSRAKQQAGLLLTRHGIQANLAICRDNQLNKGYQRVLALALLTSMPIMSDTLATPSAHSSMGDKHLQHSREGCVP